MANLVVTFTEGTPTGQLRQDQANFPKFVGSAARSELVLIDSSTTAGALVALATEGFVVIKAGAECHVNVGAAPVAVDGEGWHLTADQQIELFVSVGEGVACIAATTIN